MLGYPISLSEAARRLCISENSLLIAIQKGQISYFIRDGRIVFCQSSLSEYYYKQHPNPIDNAPKNSWW
jgi:hypothetical protein